LKRDLNSRGKLKFNGVGMGQINQVIDFKLDVDGQEYRAVYSKPQDLMQINSLIGMMPDTISECLMDSKLDLVLKIDPFIISEAKRLVVHDTETTGAVVIGTGLNVFNREYKPYAPRSTQSRLLL